jgi:hypothetical protein
MKSKKWEKQNRDRTRRALKLSSLIPHSPLPTPHPPLPTPYSLLPNQNFFHFRQKRQRIKLPLPPHMIK